MEPFSQYFSRRLSVWVLLWSNAGKRQYQSNLSSWAILEIRLTHVIYCLLHHRFHCNTSLFTRNSLRTICLPVGVFLKSLKSNTWRNEIILRTSALITHDVTFWEVGGTSQKNFWVPFVWILVDLACIIRFWLLHFEEKTGENIDFQFHWRRKVVAVFSFRITFKNTAETKSGIFNMVARKSIFCCCCFWPWNVLFSFIFLSGKIYIFSVLKWCLSCRGICFQESLLSNTVSIALVSGHIKFALRCRMAPKEVSMYCFQCSVVCL